MSEAINANTSNIDWTKIMEALDGKVNTTDVSYKCIYGKGQAPIDDIHAIEDEALGVNGTISNNQRYVLDNPFGSDTPVIVVAEVFGSNKWAISGWTYISGGYGARGSFVQGDGIVVQTGGRFVKGTPAHTGGGHGVALDATSAPCRVHVWKVGV